MDDIIPYHEEPYTVNKVFIAMIFALNDSLSRKEGHISGI